MAVTFYGTGRVYIPDGGRSRFVGFTDGKYTTSDEVEIAAMLPNFKHDGIVEKEEAPPAEVKRGRPRRKDA